MFCMSSLMSCTSHLTSDPKDQSVCRTLGFRRGGQPERRQERRLSTVACKPLFGPGCPAGLRDEVSLVCSPRPLPERTRGFRWATDPAAGVGCVHGTSLISTVQPTASAYLCNVAMDGECFWLPPPASNRATAEGVVPMRSATSVCVRPARFLACNSSANQANSASSALYSARTWGSRRAFAL